MKKQIFTILLFSSVLAYSQVGINTETPKATLDVTGKPSDISKIDGLIAPRLTGLELKAKDALYGAEQNATLIYVTEALVASDTSSKTANVTSIGYFYFDGNIWQKLTAQSTGNAGNDWSLLGNSGTNTDVSSGVPNFIGTTDAVDFVVKTNNTEKERTCKTVNTDNSIKKITGGDLNLNGITVGRGKGNNINNTVIAYRGLESNTTGSQNIGIGAYALYPNTTGGSNVAIGHSSLSNNTEGQSNVAVGQSSLAGSVTGSNNIAIGHSALSNNLNKTGTKNIGIGTTAGNALEDGTTNNIAIGSRQQLANKTGSNQLNIGGVIFGTGLTGSAIAPAGNIGIGIATPNSSASLHLGASDKGVLINQVNLISRTDIATVPNPVAGMLVYSTNENTLAGKGYYFWSGSSWTKVISESDGSGFGIGEERGYTYIVNAGIQGGTGVGSGVSKPTINQMTGRTSFGTKSDTNILSQWLVYLEILKL